MNKLLLLSAAFLTLSFTTTESTLPTKHIHGEAIVPQNDKAFLRDYYRETKNQLKKSIKGLSTAQLQYKPSASEWSVSQCLEHIIKTEKAIFGMTKEALEKPANPERKDEVKVTDQQLIDGMTDRSEKAEAPAMLTGTGSYQDVATALKDFQAQRTEILDYIETVPLDELRNHINDSPFGPVDSYHSILFIAAHTARHTLQIEEVKSKDTFPKE
ncbi:hypothetical protein GCM10007415_32640 [Parapedobacter pyrenivorans]|uniref:DinB-like domain-containing protein n=1 Tax=Parapedobacter pyrenivorans TaxID=1305674 RepID=A0A917MD37_9SPHI|nr:DinB family protein [Parapedobacter pyrenivorans]GGG94941.1 hypothetical protein GCM10007415_32640 [Parapedobacter pyrenivorans]